MDHHCHVTRHLNSHINFESLLILAYLLLVSNMVIKEIHKSKNNVMSTNYKVDCKNGIILIKPNLVR